MGVRFFDQYSLLHFSAGVAAYFFGIKLIYWIIIHVLFEYVENTQCGMDFINNNLKSIWPGGKDFPDSFLNSMIGDNFFAISGWLVAFWLDKLGKKHNWHDSYN